MRITRRGALVGAALSMPLLSHPARGSDRTLRISMEGDPDTLDPHKSNLVYASFIHRQIWLPLTTLDPKGEVVGGAAESWSVSPDGKTYEFKIAPAQTWSDGKPFNAEDIVYSFRRMLTAETLYEQAELFYGIQGAAGAHQRRAPIESIAVTAPDDLTVIIRLTVPNPFFARLVSIAYPAPRHAIERHGASWTQSGNIATAGPFTLAERIPNNKIVLLRDPRSRYAAQTALDRIEVYPLADQAASTRRFLSGEMDIHYSATPIEYDRLRKQRPGEAHLFPSLRGSFMTFNTRRPALKDMPIRRALSLLIDREMIAEKIVGGGAVAGYTITPPDWPGIDPRSFPDYAAWPMERRLAEAIRLLTDAGHGGQNPFRIELIYSGQIRQRIAIALQSMFKAGGVELSILSKEVGGLFAQLDAGDFDCSVSGYDNGGLIDPFDVVTGFEPQGWANRSGHASAEMVTEMDKARKTADAAERSRALAAAEMQFMSAYPIAPLYHEKVPWFIAGHVKGWSPEAQPLFLRNLRIEK